MYISWTLLPDRMFWLNVDGPLKRGKDAGEATAHLEAPLHNNFVRTQRKLLMPENPTREFENIDSLGYLTLIL